MLGPRGEAAQGQSRADPAGRRAHRQQVGLEPLAASRKAASGVDTFPPICEPCRLRTGGPGMHGRAGHGRSLSLVIPAFNEEAGIATAITEADDALARLGDDYEILIVDDGSRDHTF